MFGCTSISSSWKTSPLVRSLLLSRADDAMTSLRTLVWSVITTWKWRDRGHWNRRRCYVLPTPDRQRLWFHLLENLCGTRAIWTQVHPAVILFSGQVPGFYLRYAIKTSRCNRFTWAISQVVNRLLRNRIPPRPAIRMYLLYNLRCPSPNGLPWQSASSINIWTECCLWLFWFRVLFHCITSRMQFLFVLSLRVHITFYHLPTSCPCSTQNSLSLLVSLNMSGGT